MSNPEDCFFHYLPANEDGASTTVNVTGAGRFVSGPGDKYPPAGHPTLYNFEWRRGRTLPEFQILLFTDCAGEFESEATGLVRFEDSALMVLFPGIWHRYRPLPERGWTERWLSFSGELVYRLFDFRMSGARLALTKPRDVDRLASDFDDLLNTIHNAPGTDPMLFSLKALRIIIEAATCRFEDALKYGAVTKDTASYPKVQDPVVREALEIIWSHSHCPMSVNDIARQLPVTRRTLDRRFAESVGHSVLEEINTCRLSRAKRLLKATDLPVKIVAHLAGFSSAERMRVAFVEHEQTPPLAYRRKHALK
jgi:AraC-like DNA-binding protein